MNNLMGYGALVSSDVSWDRVHPVVMRYHDCLEIRKPTVKHVDLVNRPNAQTQRNWQRKCHSAKFKRLCFISLHFKKDSIDIIRWMFLGIALLRPYQPILCSVLLATKPCSLKSNSVSLLTCPRFFDLQLKLRLSSLDDDPENEYDNEELVFAPRAEKEAYLSVADEAAQANEIASAASSSTNTQPRELVTEMEQSFLQYALSIIMGRAIPDARDGLKPVHRRILYAMEQLQLNPNAPYRKCARVVGEVLGKFHPHGDVAVYDSLVRLAQQFNTNHPLIDGHGNFGSIDADPAAAMRYTECRLMPLTKAALFCDLHPTIVDYIPNFDGNEQEPTVLPARVPILLLNGSSGIAVGMATNIPPHNLRELMSACIALIAARRDATIVSDAELLRLIPAPDFPTGATIVGTDGSHRLYTTGNGGIVLRAKTKLESILHGGPKKKRHHNSLVTVSTQKPRTAIVIEELPYQVNKATLIERIASMVNDKKIEGVSDLRDESDREGIRIVIELKRDADVSAVQQKLWQKTALQTTFVSTYQS
jgi:hypothetical protein